MASIADWNANTRGTFREDGDVSQHRARRSLGGALVHKLVGLFRRRAARRFVAAPAAPKSLIYALCEEYQQLDLWAAYYAFRLDPQARTWERLRRRNIPWQREQTVEASLHRLCPMNNKRTPDAAAVGLALITTPSSSSAHANRRERTT